MENNKTSELSFTDEMRIRAKHHCPDEQANEMLYKAATRIEELETHLERVLSWKETTELVAPSCGGLIKQMNVAKSILNSKPELDIS